MNNLSLFLILLSLSCSVFAQSYLQIGALMTIGDVERAENSSYDGNFEEEGRTAIEGWKFWESLCNERGIEINGVNYLVNITYINVGATVEKVMRVTNETCHGVYGEFDLLFAPWSSGLTEAAAMAAFEYDVLMFAGWASSESIFRCPREGWEDVYPCTGPYTRRFPNLWGILSDNADTFDSVLNILKLKGATNIFTWTTDTVYTNAVISGTENLATNAGLELLGSVVVEAVPTEEEIDGVLDQVEKLKPEIIVGASRYLDGCEMFLKKMKERNLNADAILLNDCQTDIDESLYIIDFTEYHVKQRGTGFEDSLYFPSTDTQTSSELFREAYIVYSGIENPTFTRGIPNAFGLGELVELTFSRSASKNLSDVNQVLPFIKESTFLNGIEFDSTGMNDGMIRSLVQVDSDGTKKIISPLSTSNLDIIYPFPAWDDRSQEEGFLKRVPDIVIFIINCVFMTFTVVMVVLILTKLNYPSIMAATPSFIILTLVGSFFMYLGVMCWMMWVNDFMCIAKNYFLGTGIVLLFATLVAKTHRMKRIFIFSSIVVKTISEAQLFIIIGVLVGIEIIIHTIWAIVTSPHAIYVVVDPYRPVLNYYTCNYGEDDNIFIIIQVIYKGALVIYALYLSTVLWKYQKSIYVESREIVFCIYNLTIFGGIFAAVQISLEPTSSRDLLFILRSVCILFSTGITVFTLSTTKILKKETGKNFDFNNARNRSSKNSKKSTGHTSGTNTGSGQVSTTEFQKEKRARRELTKKYNHLKRAVFELKDEYDFSLSLSE